MSNKTKHEHRAAAEADPVEDLYFEFLDVFYGEQNYVASERVAKRLEKAVAECPEENESIRGEEIRSLIAELRGDFQTAISSREAEIRKIFELHSISINTPGWDYVFSIYDFRDISDRLDLLALLYGHQGELDRALAVMEESKLFCKAHKIRFDGKDILDELEEAQRMEANNRSRPTRSRPRGKKSRSISVKRRNGAAARSRRSA